MNMDSWATSESDCDTILTQKSCVGRDENGKSYPWTDIKCDVNGENCKAGDIAISLVEGKVFLQIVWGKLLSFKL